MVFPLVIGAGKRFFAEGGESVLRLVEAKPVGDAGVVTLIYAPAQVGEDGEDAAVGAAVVAEAELLEDLLDVGLDGALGDEQAGGDGPVREPLGDQREHLALAFGELVEGVGAAFAGEQPGDDRRVDDGLPVGEAASASIRMATSKTRSLSR